MFDQLDSRPPLSQMVKWLLRMWFALAIPVTILFPVIGMAYDAGPTLDAHCYAWSVLTYPFTLGVAFAFRRKYPALVWIPSANVIVFAVALVTESIRRNGG